MKLERLRLKNFCQHRELDWSFPNGIVAILGPNGSGKSNAVKAAYAALTGDFKRNEGVITDNISKTCLEKDESYVELTFSTSGNVATITRHLRPNKRSLVINGGKPITSEKDIAVAIEGLIGINNDILSDYIFVDQWKMFEVFTASKSERMSALQSLYGLGRAEVCYDEISKISGKINIQMPSESIEDIQAHIREKSLLLSSLQSSIASISHESMDDSLLQNRLKVIRQVKSDMTQIVSIKSNLEKASLRVKELEDAVLLESAASILDGFANMDELNSALTEIDNSLRIWHDIDRKNARRSEIEAAIAYSTKKLEDLGPEPAKPAMYYPSHGPEFNSYNSLIGSLESKVSCLSELKGKNECPICKSSGDVLVEATKLLNDSIEELTPIVAAMKKAYEDSRNYDSILRAYSEKHARLKVSVDRDSEDLVELSKIEIAEPVKSKNLCISENVRLTTIRGKYLSALEKLSELTSNIAFYKGQVDTMSEQVAKLEVACKGFDDIQECAALEEKIVGAIAAATANKEKYIRSEEAIKGCIETIDMLEKRRNRISLDLDEARVNIGIKDHLETLKDVLHRSNLPRKVAVNYLKQTVAKMNGYLEDFNAVFRVYSDDELVFWAKFNDGRELPASRLSGGENGLLSMAFRLAVQFGVAASVNLLVLDEPTVGLDDDNVECLETAFNRLRAMAKSSGMQVLIVSHEKAIERMCDHTLSLYR